MSLDYVRQIVSGNKARFVDKEAAVDLDLVYVTDRIIIMGWPATGWASAYRNRRRDVLRFINSRHGEKWWIWNLCPLHENAYSPESMHNRVSRYPFPDHHPPPLPLLPLAVREMTAWLEGDAERVAIIHCKAGKGRSGTLLCSYLLSLQQLPPPPQLDRSYSHHDLVRRRRDAADTADDSGWVLVGKGQDVEEMRVPGADAGDGAHTPARSERLQVSGPYGDVPRSTTSSTTTISHPSPPPSINIAVTSIPPYEPIDIGDERAPGETGQQDRADGRVDEVFRLHSSRRMKPTSSGRGVSIPSQRRWCRYVHLLFTKQAPASYLSPRPPRVRLISVTILLSPPSGWQKPLAALVVGSGGSGQGRAWASVARYNDAYVDELRRRGGGGQGVDGEIAWGGVGGDGVFDTQKMFRSFGKLVPGDLSERDLASLPSDHKNYNTHHLVPNSASPLILDRSRELRLKLHLASLPLGWAWFVPAFHLPEPPASPFNGSTRTHTLDFPRSQIDFPLGPGQSIHRVLVRLEEIPADEALEPARLMTEEEERDIGEDDRIGEKVKEEGE